MPLVGVLELTSEVEAHGLTYDGPRSHAARPRGDSPRWCGHTGALAFRLAPRPVCDDLEDL